ncbi:hypothetical protein K449DRAFT_438072 [Hypoxylon sp. EC38]|nr:hypothetical protein K449DRAFT_438072 [Hypoxylon sp. EC38]
MPKKKTHIMGKVKDFLKKVKNRLSSKKPPKKEEPKRHSEGKEERKDERKDEWVREEPRGIPHCGLPRNVCEAPRPHPAIHQPITKVELRPTGDEGGFTHLNREQLRLMMIDKRRNDENWRFRNEAFNTRHRPRRNFHHPNLDRHLSRFDSVPSLD